MSELQNKKGFRVVYTIVERREKKYWTRVGAAFANRDGSVNLVLDAIPMSGNLQIRDARPTDEPGHRRAQLSPANHFHSRVDE